MPAEALTPAVMKGGSARGWGRRCLRGRQRLRRHQRRTHRSGGSGGSLKDGDGRSQGGRSDDSDGDDVEGQRGRHVEERESK
jgi:hypothetical protein